MSVGNLLSQYLAGAQNQESLVDRFNKGQKSVRDREEHLTEIATKKTQNRLLKEQVEGKRLANDAAQLEYEKAIKNQELETLKRESDTATMLAETKGPTAAMTFLKSSPTYDPTTTEYKVGKDQITGLQSIMRVDRKTGSETAVIPLASQAGQAYDKASFEEAEKQKGRVELKQMEIDARKAADEAKAALDKDDPSTDKLKARALVKYSQNQTAIAKGETPPHQMNDSEVMLAQGVLENEYMKVAMEALMNSELMFKLGNKPDELYAAAKAFADGFRKQSLNKADKAFNLYGAAENKEAINAEGSGVQYSADQIKKVLTQYPGPYDATERPYATFTNNDGVVWILDPSNNLLPLGRRQ